MSEVQNADDLARWLDSVPGAPVPASIDQDVVETIYALKPEMAPPHSLSIHEVLESILEGPLVDPAVANALRNWLKAGPGTPPPRLLPIGVVEATYALRPDMAPGPSLSIDDILDGVTEGPFAQKSSSSHAGSEPLRLHTEAAPVPQTKASSSFRLGGPAIGAMAMAAIALLVIYPGSEDVITAASPFDGSSAIADAPKLQSVTFDAAEPGGMSPPAPASASEKPKAKRARKVSPNTAKRAQAPKRKPSPALSAAPAELLPPEKQSSNPPVLMDAKSIPLEDMGAAEETESAEAFAIPRAPPAAAVEPRATSRRDSRKSRGRNRADRDMAEGVTETAEPASAHSSIDYWHPKIQRLKGNGNAAEALAQLEAILPMFATDMPSRLKLLRLKVEILQELGRNTEAQQVERLIKSIKAVEY